MSDPISAITFKHGPVQDLRCFGSLEAVRLAELDPATLHSVRGIFVNWPASLGAPPDDATVQTWEAEHDAAVSAKQAKKAEVKAAAESDTFIDRLRSATAVQIAVFVNNNVTDLASAKQFLTKLGIAVAYTLQGGREK